MQYMYSIGGRDSRQNTIYNVGRFPTEIRFSEVVCWYGACNWGNTSLFRFTKSLAEIFLVESSLKY